MKRDFDPQNLNDQSLLEQNLQKLCETFAALKKPDEVRSFLLDLCTPNEIQALADRWQVARLVSEGVPYREISRRTGVSTATITRVGRFIRTGEGYQIALGKKSERNASLKRARSTQ